MVTQENEIKKTVYSVCDRKGKQTQTLFFVNFLISYSSREKMDRLLRSKFCSFCLRNISERRQVRGSIRLKHSGSSVAVVVSYIMGQDIPVAALCFRCYKLILGIDYHQHEFKRLKDMLVRLYKERCITVEKVRSSDFSKTMTEYSASLAVDGSTDDARALFSVCSDFATATSHLSMDQDALERYFLCESDTIIPPENLMSPTRPVYPLQKISPFEMNEKIKKMNSAKDINPKETAHQVTTRSSNRKKTLKKMKDFEYNTDYTKDKEETSHVENSVNPANEIVTKIRNETEKYSTICEKEITSKKDIYNHSSMKALKKNNLHSCKGCQLQFSERTQYIKHINSCYKNVPVQCDLCSMELKSAAYLPRHLEAFHNESATKCKGTLCDLCGRTFSRKESLQRHQAKVHGISHGTFQCTVCGQTFPHTSFLMEHMRAHKGYPCYDCKKIFTCISNLKLHNQTVHQKKALYSCSLCSKKWKFHASYTHHMRKVHGMAQFKCLKCKLLFSSENAFEKHKRLCIPSSQKGESTSDVKQIQENESLLKSLVQNGKINSKGAVDTLSSGGRDQSYFPQAKHQDNGNPDNTSRKLKSNENRQSSDINRPTTRSIRGKCRIKNYACMNGDSLTDADLQNFEVSSLKTSKVEVALMPSDDNFEELKISNVSSFSEIVLETIDDISSDCQFVILVDDGSNEQM